MSNLLIHLGYQKSGSTWLQRFVFDNPDVGFITPFVKSAEIADHLVLPHALDFNALTARNYFSSAFNNRDVVRVPVLTSERLCGSPHAGGYDSKEMADRLAAVFPEAKILIVIREQKSMIFSTYKQYVRAGGRCSLKRYLYPPVTGRSRVPLFSFDHFKYDRLIRYYQQLFGGSNVLVCTFEHFRADPRVFVERIIIHAG